MAESTRFSVAVHVLSVLGYLEQSGVKLVSSSQIAQSVNTNAVVIRNLMSALKKAKLVRSKEGKNGGLYLARKPSQISLQEIYSAVETEGVLSSHQKPHFAPCPVSRGMKKVFLNVSKEVDGAVAKVLHKKTLKDIVDQF